MNSKNLLLAACVGLSSLLATSCQKDPDVMPSESEMQETSVNKLSKSAIQEFLAFAKTPRLGYHLDKAQAYLMNWARDHGYVCHTDASQNVWFDVPATTGMESAPKVILQAHMDQICASVDGETYDYTQVVGEPYYEGDLLKGRKVNLGADDGSGVGMILALAASDIPHGELRVLITTNEDYGMEGARTLSADVLDAPYLINIDNEWLGEIAIGCYGGFRETIAKTYLSTTPSADQKKMHLSVSGLKGGHSGVEIGNGHLSASAVLDAVVREVVIPASGQLVTIQCGAYENAIPSTLELEFAVKSGDADVVKRQLETMVAGYKTAYPEENGKWTVEVKNWTGDEKLCDVRASEELKYLFDEIQQGVIEKDNLTGRITKSNNVGVVTLTGGEFAFRFFPRSDFSEWLVTEQQHCGSAAAFVGMKTEITSSNPCWESDGKDELTKLMVQCHDELGIQNKVTKAPGGLETAYFSQKNPEMKCVSVGPTIDNAHSIDEALHISTVKSLMQVLVKVLKNIGDSAEK